MTDDDTRSRGDERRRMMGELELERNQLIRNIETCRIRDIDRPFIEEWSLKDIVGHVATWEGEVLTALRQLKAGFRPALLDFNTDQLDHFNRDHVERKRDLDFWSVLEQLRGTRSRLLDELEELDDDTLTEDGSVHGALVRAVTAHDRSHWHDIAAKLAGTLGTREKGSSSIPEFARAPQPAAT